MTALPAISEFVASSASLETELQDGLVWLRVCRRYQNIIDAWRAGIVPDDRALLLIDQLGLEHFHELASRR